MMRDLNIDPMAFGLSYVEGLLNLRDALELHFKFILDGQYDESYISIAKQAIKEFEQGNLQATIKRYVHKGGWEHESSHIVNEVVRELNLYSFLNHTTVAESGAY